MSNTSSNQETRIPESIAAPKRWQDTWLGRRGIRILLWGFWPPWRWRFYCRRPMHNCDQVNELLLGFVSVTWVNRRWR